MVYDLRAYWLVYPLLLKTEREEKERQMLFKMSNPPACDEVCSSAVCLRSQSNNGWQLHSASAAPNLFRFGFISRGRALFRFLLIPSDKEKKKKYGSTEEMAALTDVALIVALISLHVRSMCRCLTEVSLRVLMRLTAEKIDERLCVVTFGEEYKR